METPKNHEQTQNQTTSDWSILKDVPFAGTIKDKYEQGQHPITEQVKQELLVGTKSAFDIKRQVSEYGRELHKLDSSGFGRAKQLVATSSLWRHINPKGYEKAWNIRKAEATKVALDEYEAEREAAAEDRRLQLKQDEAQRKAEYERHQAEWEAERAKLKQEQEDRRFIEAADVIRYNHHEHIVGAKIQELAERAFDAKLTSVEEIVAYAEAGEGASAETINYEDQEIPIYHINQVPIKFLQTTINYKEANRGTSFGEHGIGFQSMENLVNNPSFWDNDVSVTTTFKDKSNDERLANTISMSYVDEEYSSYGSVDFARVGEEPPISYAFTRIQPDLLITIRKQDAASSQNMGEHRPENHDFASIDPDNFIINSQNRYNELVMRRYDPSTGKLLYRPDFIRTKNGQISEAMLKHAAYFNIPIVDINQAELDKTREAYLVDKLTDIDENSSYEDIAKSAQLVYKHTSAKIPHEYGSEMSKANRAYQNSFGHIHPEMTRVLDLEHVKALDYAEMQIRLAIKSLQKGESRHDTLDDFLHINPAENYHDHTARLIFTIGRRGGAVDRRDFTIIDGANTPDDQKREGTIYDSTVYNRFKPLLEAFIQAQTPINSHRRG